MKLPNGFGRITELKGKLRKPFRAMVTIGKDENGRPIGKILKPEGYFATYNEAYAALMEYNRNPYDFDSDVTLKEVYEKWYEVHTKKLSASRIKGINSAWKYCSILYDYKIQTIKTKAIRLVLEEGYKLDTDGNKVYPSDNMKNIMKMVLSGVMDYAVEHEIIAHNYVKDVKLEKDNEAKNPHKAFTDEEMNIITQHLDDPVVRLMYIQIYTGLRPGELCELKSNNLDMKEWVIVGGMKTTAGKNRTIPIHRRIRNYVQNCFTESFKAGSSYLITYCGRRLLYDTYFDLFASALSKYGLNTDHRPHDCRKQFVTMAKKYKVDEYAIKRIVGHSIKDITESIYTERGNEWLHDEIGKIP